MSWSKVPRCRPGQSDDGLRGLPAFVRRSGDREAEHRMRPVGRWARSPATPGSVQSGRRPASRGQDDHEEERGPCRPHPHRTVKPDTTSTSRASSSEVL